MTTVSRTTASIGPVISISWRAAASRFFDFHAESSDLLGILSPQAFVVVDLQQQAVVIAHTEAGVADLFGRDIRIPIAEALIPFTDILVLIFSNFSLMCWASRLLPAALVSLGIPE